jgi:sulfopyruvate decarboxylase subunit beta
MASSRQHSGRMPVVAALQALINARQENQMVITNQASARVYPQLSQHPLDFHYNPSTMGGAIPLGLGLAIAQPRRQVIVVSGDGSLLMSLGALVTVVGKEVSNLTIVVLSNDMYEVTGGQKTPARPEALDLAGIARACGFTTALEFAELSSWQSCIAEIPSLPGPRFISLAVEPTPKEYLAAATPPLAEQLARLRRALDGNSLENP